MNTERALTVDEQIADDIGKFWDNPLGFVMYAYDWDTDRELQVVKLPSPWNLVYNSEYGPDAWACELLTRIGEQVKAHNFDPYNPIPCDPIREAIASGHGIGKSALVAWLTDWIMSTRPHSKGTITANTAEQLSNKTWAEIAKWTKRCITGHWFDVTTGKGAMKMEHKEHRETWRCSAQTCREENSEAFAGQHAPTGTSFYIFDEASAVPDKIKEVSDGGLTDGEPMMFAFGNPTRNVGWFKDCFGAQSHRWGTKQIDSRTVQVTNKKLHAEWIADYGIDSDFCKVRIRGLFPAMSARQYISQTDIDAAYGKHLRLEQYNFAPKVISVDPAWDGDDEFIIGVRQGLHYRQLRVIPKNDNDIEMARLIAQYEDDEQADAVFIDAGYGTGIVSAGIAMGRSWQLVWFAGASPDPGFLNMRAWIHGQMRNWLKSGGAIPPDPKLVRDLTAIETVGRVDGVIQLIAKKDIKKELGWSPGRSDCLAISFAFPVVRKAQLLPGTLVPQPAVVPYDPYAAAGGSRGAGQTQQGGYDPYANLT